VEETEATRHPSLFLPHATALPSMTACPSSDVEP
jgi:hypothetical protein